MQKLVKTQKSTNNRMSIFGLIEENMELSHIDLAVKKRMLLQNRFQSFVRGAMYCRQKPS
jgi:hypothetical protein